MYSNKMVQIVRGVLLKSTKLADAALYQHPHSEVAQSIPVEVERCQGVEVQ